MKRLQTDDFCERMTKPLERMQIFPNGYTSRSNGWAIFVNGWHSRSNGLTSFLNGSPKPFERMQIFSERVRNGLWTDFRSKTGSR